MNQVSGLRPPPSILDPGVTRVFALLAVLSGLVVGLAVGLHLPQNLLIGAVLSPFLLMLIYARPHWAVLVYVVLVYADLLSILVKYHDFPPLARFAGAIMLSAVLGYRLIYQRERLKMDVVTRWLIAYGVVVALGLVYARDTSLVATNLVEFIRNFLTYLIIVNALTTAGRLKATLGAVLAMGTLLALLSIYQSVTGHIDTDFGGLAQYRVSEITGSTDAARPGGTLGDANYYGQSLLILVPIGLYFAFEARHALARLGGLFATLALVGGVVFTYSRGDAVALGGIVVAAVVYKRPNPAYLVGAAFLLMLALPLLPANYLARLGTIVGAATGSRQAILTEDSLRGRAGAVQAAAGMFADHPILGVGRENYPLYQLQYLEGTGIAKYAKAIPPHDLYLEIATEHGLVGLVVVGGLLAAAWGALREARRRFLDLQRTRDAALAAWLGIGMIGYLLSSLFLHGAFLYMLWLQLALIVALRQIARVAGPLPAQQAQPVQALAPEVPAVVDVPARAYLLPVALGKEGTMLTMWKLLPFFREKQEQMQTQVQIPTPAPAAYAALDEHATEMPETVAGDEVLPVELFRRHWETNGGEAVFGHAIGPALHEVDTEGESLDVQYYRYARLEHRSKEDGTPGEITVGKLGLEVPIEGRPVSALPPGLQGRILHLREGHRGPGVPAAFYEVWRLGGGLPVFGNPITSVVAGTSEEGQPFYLQYFERACFEYHPEQAGTSYAVQLAPLGAQVYSRRYGGER